ncbi:heme-binding domain-containing protein [Mangrovibacterium sp.]|uniref:heme-binding domain-containing protein n=1 Tax=Mangrovibacterium sp. TaxID=1961364 RepID=UPI00356A0DA6
MKRFLKPVSIFAVVVLVAIQFVQPAKNLGEPTENHLFRQSEIPINVQTVLQNACLDCHSDYTNYKWYHQAAPVSWFVANHIREGKRELNFSTWESISAIDQVSLLEDMKKEVEEGEMPLKSYTLVHHEARLSAAQKDSLYDWIVAYQELLLLKAFE